MNCIGCDREGIETLVGVWCDPCGGVVGRSAERDALGNVLRDGLLLLRHVATVDGGGGRYPVVFDSSTGDYSASWPRVSSVVRPTVRIDPDLQFRVNGIHTVHGTLDAVLAIVQPAAKGDSSDWPELSVAPTATVEERKLLGVGPS